MEMDAETAAVVVKTKDCLEEAAEEAGEKLSGQQHHHHHRGEGVISDAASTPVLPLAQVLSHFLPFLGFFFSLPPQRAFFFPVLFFRQMCLSAVKAKIPQMKSQELIQQNQGHGFCFWRGWGGLGFDHT
jgi:hypothetical protein